MPTIDKFRWRKDDRGNEVMYLEDEKESGIEKVLELLNEFETPQSGVVFKSYDDYDGTFNGVDCDGKTEIAWSDSYILSKRFQFVEWLVDNDKIDYKKLHGEKWYLPLVDAAEFDGGKRLEVLLMLLSIQDEPIQFLISILK